MATQEQASIEAQIEIDPEGALTTNVTTSPVVRFFETSWRFFNSLRLTVFLLFSLGAGCFVGMFYDQTRSYEEFAQEWSSAAWKLNLFTFLEFHDVFHSWWFGAFILLLALNLTACSIERLPKIWIDIQNPRRDLADEQMRGIRHRFKTVINADQKDKAIELASAIFSGSVVKHEKDGITYLYDEKHKYARTGVYIVHLSLLAIMFGSMATTNFGIDGMMMVPEDKVEGSRLVRVRGPGGLPYAHDLGFRVRCTDFRLKTFIDGAPMEFESDLEVYDDASPINPVLRKTIQVNDPLEYKGYTFYQASYQPMGGNKLVQLDVGERGKQRLMYQIDIGQRLTMPDKTVFEPIELIPDYGGLGEAVKIQETDPTGNSTFYVVFRSYPEYDALVRRGKYDVQFHGADQTYATGIQVGRVPGVIWVFGGFVFMFVGMYMAFFMSHRRYWARLRPIENGATNQYEFIVAGAARRHQYSFEEEFAKMREALVAVFGGSSTADRARALREQRKNARQKATNPNDNSAEKSA